MFSSTMSPATFVILSGCLTFGAPLALAIRELITLRRRPPSSWLPPAPPPPTPRAPKPLPDCLIPKPLPQRTRELVH